MLNFYKSKKICPQMGKYYPSKIKNTVMNFTCFLSKVNQVDNGAIVYSEEK
jgi:hypothetical protein